MLHRITAFWRGIFALFFRSLRTESRSLRMHLLWFLLLAVIYFTLCVVQQSTNSFGAPGLYLFRCVMYLNAAFITLLGVSFFSTVISEEKEEDTLGLMTMAGISPLGILLGKSTSRLFQVSLLLAIQYPFTLLAVTLGGLMPVQITSAYTSLLAYTILLANVGLLCSVACRTNRNASGLTTFWLVGYFAIPAFAYAGQMYLLRERQWSNSDWVQGSILYSLDWIARSTVVTDLFEATETGHQFSWSPQIIGNTIGGLLCFLMSLCLFGFVAKEPATDTTSRGLVARRTTSYLRIFSAGRAWPWPLVWKDFFFTAGGWAGLVIRSLLYVGLYILCYWANRPWQTNAGYTIRWNDVTHGFQFFAHPLLAIDIALCASRIFHDEIRGQTLSSLLMLPESTLKLIYSKILGCAIATSPGVIALIGSILMLPGGTETVAELVDAPLFWWWVMNLLLLIHLTAAYSLFLRSGAFVLALGTMIGTMMFTGFMLAMIAIASGGSEPAFFFELATVLLGLICVACHGIIFQKMPRLGER